MKTIILALALGFAGFCAIAADAPTADDLTALQGKWTIQSVSKDGQDIPNAAGGQLVFTKDKVSMTPQGRPDGLDMTVTLDTTRTPKTIAFRPIQPGAKGGLGNGAYELSGDKLKLAFAHPEKTYTEISDKGQMLFVLKRQNP